MVEQIYVFSIHIFVSLKFHSEIKQSSFYETYSQIWELENFC